MTLSAASALCGCPVTAARKSSRSSAYSAASGACRDGCSPRDVSKECYLTEVPTRLERRDPVSVLGDFKLPLGDDVEPIAGIPFTNDHRAGVDAKRHEPCGEMLERSAW